MLVRARRPGGHGGAKLSRRGLLAGDALNRCRFRRRIQQMIHGHRGRKATRSTPPAGCCTPVLISSPTSSVSGFVPPSPAMSTFRSRRRGGSASA